MYGLLLSLKGLLRDFWGHWTWWSLGNFPRGTFILFLGEFLYPSGTFGSFRGLSGSFRGLLRTYGVIRMTFEVLRRTFGVLQRTFGVLRRTFGVLRLIVGVQEKLLGSFGGSSENILSPYGGFWCPWVDFWRTFWVLRRLLRSFGEKQSGEKFSIFLRSRILYLWM